MEKIRYPKSKNNLKKDNYNKIASSSEENNQINK